jgi:exopolysaccharide biosynthesis protein
MSSFDVTGYKVFKGEYVDFKESNNVYVLTQPDKLGSFLKGEIKLVEDDMTQIMNVAEGEFYLLAKDGSLDGKLSVGTKLKCEYELTGAFANVPNTIGYNHPVLENGVPLYQGISYLKDLFISTTHPRTLVGFKADGSAVMMVVDGRGAQSTQRTGISLFEGGELLRIYDCVQGFNLDGGGSSTMIIRDQDGKLVCVNTPSD